MQYYSAIKKEDLIYVITWMNLKNMLSVRSQSQKMIHDTYLMKCLGKPIGDRMYSGGCLELGIREGGSES